MNCEQTVELLSEYIDEELADEQRKDVDAHLRECPRCRRELESLKATVALVRSLPRASAPEGLAASVADGLSGARRGKIIWPSAQVRVFVPLLAAAAVLLVVSVTFLHQRERAARMAPVATETSPEIAEEKAPGTFDAIAPSPKPRPEELAEKAENVPIRETPEVREEIAPSAGVRAKDSGTEDKGGLLRRMPSKAAPAGMEAEKTVVQEAAPSRTIADREAAPESKVAAAPPAARREELEIEQAKEKLVAHGGVAGKGEAVSKAPAAAEPPREPGFVGKKAAKTAAPPPSELRKARESQAAERTLIVRSQNPGGDMERVRSLLSKYAQEAERDGFAAGAAVEQAVEDRIVARLPAERFSEFLGDLKRMGFSVSTMTREEQEIGGRPITQQGQLGFQAEAPAPAAIRLTIVFELAK